jgi:transcriptional regulator with XRE-family HTH domain
VSAEASYRQALATYVRRERLARGWSLRDLADHSRLSTAYLSEIEHGLKEPSAAALEQLGHAFDSSLAGILIAIAQLLDPRAWPRAFGLPDLADLRPDERQELARFVEWIRFRRLDGIEPEPG